MSPLKICPFCGGEASLIVPSELVTADCADIYVACDECEAEGQHVIVEIRDRGDDLWADDRVEAIAAWNTRALSQTLPAPGEVEDIADDEALEAISDRFNGSDLYGLTEAWAEGKTLSVLFKGTGQIAKLRFVKLVDRPSNADLRGEPA